MHIKKDSVHNGVFKMNENINDAFGRSPKPDAYWVQALDGYLVLVEQGAMMAAVLGD